MDGANLTDNTEFVRYFEDDTAPFVERAIEGVFILLVSVVGIAFNLCLLLTLICSPHLSSFCNDLILMMSIADLSIVAITMPVTAYSTFIGRRDFSKEVCKGLGFFTCFMIAGSIFTMWVIGYYRYLSVCKVEVYLRRLYRIYMLLHALGIWVAAAVVSTPPLYGWGEVTYISSLYFCFADSPSYVVLLQLLLYCFTCVILTCLYMTLYEILKNWTPRVPDWIDARAQDTAGCTPDTSLSRQRSLPWWKRWVSDDTGYARGKPTLLPQNPQKRASLPDLESSLNELTRGDTSSGYHSPAFRTSSAALVSSTDSSTLSRVSAGASGNSASALHSQTDRLPPSHREVRWSLKREMLDPGRPQPHPRDEAITTATDPRGLAWQVPSLRVSENATSFETEAEDGTPLQSALFSSPGTAAAAVAPAPAPRPPPPPTAVWQGPDHDTVEAPPTGVSAVVAAAATAPGLNPLSFTDEDEAEQRLLKLPGPVDSGSRRSSPSSYQQLSVLSFMGGLRVCPLAVVDDDDDDDGVKTRLGTAGGVEPVLMEEIKLRTATALIILSFLCPALPLLFMSIIMVFNGALPSGLDVASLVLAFCVPAFKPVVYGWTNIRVRRVFIDKVMSVCGRGRVAKPHGRSSGSAG